MRARLKAGGISQEQVAAVLGLTQPMISRRVLGKTPWRAQELIAISEAFDVPLHELYNSPPELPAGDQPAAAAG